MRPTIVTMAALAFVAAACAPPAARLPPAPSALFRQAEDAFSRRNFEAAASGYRRFLDSAPQEPYVPRAYYQLALTQYYQHQYDATLATLDEMNERVRKGRWVQVRALRGDAEVGLGKRVGAVLAWEDAWTVASPAEQPHLQGRIMALAPQLTEDDRAELSDSLGVAEIREMLRLSAPVAPPAAPPKEAEKEAKALVEPAASEPSEVVAEPQPSRLEPETPEVVAADEEPPAPAVEPSSKVACLLPLTGPDHAYGMRALAGLRLAFADVPEQLLVRDTGGDPASSAQLLRDLHNDPTVLAVIGPLRSSEAEATAPVAEQAKLPLLLLSQQEGLSGRFVLQAAMTRTQEVQLLVRYATDALKLHRFGILHPKDGYGSSFAAAFTDEATRHGATVVGTEAYEPGDADAHAVTAAVQRWQRAGLDAVFIPDAAAGAMAVATAVRAELPDVALLGTESWNDPEALIKAGASINGAIFADAFFSGSARPSTQRFVQRFERGAGRAPTVFEAQAFDAGMAVRRTIADGASSRDQVIAQLTALGNFEGAGALRASARGFERTLSILRYRDGKVEEAVTSD